MSSQRYLAMTQPVRHAIAICLKPVSRISGGAGSVQSGDREELENWTVNEWDSYALEEALRLAEILGSELSALAVGGGETEPVLRRALALGAHKAFRLAADGRDPHDAAHSLAAFLHDHPTDLVLFGAQSSDRGGGQVGGATAALLGIPFVSLVIETRVEGSFLLVSREVENRRYEQYRLDFPCALSIQTGINSPRYVSVRGIQRAGRLSIEEFAVPPIPDSGLCLAGRMLPEKSTARRLDGSVEEMATELAELLRGRRA